MSRAPAATAAVLASLLAGALPSEGQQWVAQRLRALSPPSGAEFGAAVAVGDDGTIAVGDYGHDVVYLFAPDQTGGFEQSATIPGPDRGSWFGFHLAIAGKWLLVGAPKSGGTGAAYLIELPDAQASGLREVHVSESQRVSGLAPRPGSGDEVGSAVAIDGEMLAIGARGADDRRGRVYFGSKGKLTAVPTPPGLAPWAELGQSVALSGRRLVMGAPSPFRGSGSPGAAYILDLPLEGPPGTPASLRADGLENEAAFGYAVALAGNRILVGAPLADRSGVGADAGTVFDFREGDSEHPRRLRSGGEGDQLGAAVALNEFGTALIGARYTNGRAGAAYLEGPFGGALRPDEALSAGAQFGFSVAIRGDIAVVGAFREQPAGAAYFFQPPVELVVASEVEEAETRLPVGLRNRGGSPVTFQIQTRSGTAEERATRADAGDYLRLSRRVTLAPAGEALAIRLFPDSVCEERETFQVILAGSDGTPFQAVEVAIVDDDKPGLELSSPAPLRTSEVGASAAASVRLTCQPAARVTLLLSTSDDTEGAVSRDRVKFTPANWNIPKAFQVTGRDDALCDGLRTYSLQVRALSADSGYAGLSRSIPAENADDELACGEYYTVAPCRLLDTRTAADGSTPVASGSDRLVDVDGITRCAVSSLAVAVAVNVTVTEPTGAGVLGVYAADLAGPTVANMLNFLAGATRSNNAVAMLSPDGALKLRPLVEGEGTVHLILDVVGFFVEP